MVVRETELATHFSDRFSTSLSMVLAPPPGHVGFLVGRSVPGQFMVDGKDIGNDKMLFVPDGTCADIWAPALVGSESVAIPNQSFARFMSALFPDQNAPKQPTIIEGNVDQLHVLRGLMWSAVADPELDQREEEQSDLLSQIIYWMVSNADPTKPDRNESDVRKELVAKRAQEYIEEHYWDSVTIDSLCLATGIGVRSLQQCFKERFQLTVTEYLKARRLDAVYRELKRRDPHSCSVTEVALLNGFNHLGRFSVDFHRHFGARPSEVLGKRSGRSIRTIRA